MQKEYRYVPDRLGVIVYVSALLILVLIPKYFVLSTLEIVILIVCAAAICYSMFWLFFTKYVVTDSEIIIKSFVHYKIPLNNIEKVELRKGSLALRLMGITSVCGVYYIKGVGTVIMFGAPLKEHVLIYTKDGRKICVSPEKAAEFVEEISKKIKK